MSTSLYQLANEYQQALNDALFGDEVSIELVDTLRNLEGAIDDKAIAIATAIKNFEVEAVSVGSAIKEMQDRKRKVETKIEALENYLKNNLESSGIKEIRKSPHFVIRVKQNPPSVFIENEGSIADKYKVTKQVVMIDKNSIKEDLKNGVEVTGAHLIQNTRLEIK